MIEVAGNGGTKCTMFARCQVLLESGQARVSFIPWCVASKPWRS